MSVRDNAQQRMLRVDLSTGAIGVEDLPREWTGKYLGARGVTGRLLYDEVQRGTDPYGPENVLYIGTGPMDGLPVGMQIIGRHLDDPLVLRASAAFEQAQPWKDRWPPISAH